MEDQHGTQLGEDSGYWISISDLMSGLLIIFILTLAYYMLTFTEKTTRLIDNNFVRQELLYEIKTEIENRNSNLRIEIDDEHGVLRLPEGVLFDSGQAEIKDEGREALSDLAAVLFEVLNKAKYGGRVETIFVEGHTDSNPFMGLNHEDLNWELSTRRAINSWRVLLEHEARLEDLDNAEMAPLFSCSGYGPARPIDLGKDPISLEKNRRIDLRFTMTPPKPEDAEIVVDVRQDLQTVGH